VLPLDAVVLCAFALYRLARFIPADALFHDVRARLYRWAWVDVEPTAADPDPDPIPRAGQTRVYLHALLTCPWCMGVWLAPLVWFGYRYGGPGGRAAVIVFAIMGGQSILAGADHSMTKDL